MTTDTLIAPTDTTKPATIKSIRYGQCWEDADVLLEGLDVRPDDVCVSVASAGDNALSMLSRSPACVIAVDLSAGQLACVELRVAAYKCLMHNELLQLMGSIGSDQRPRLYERCRRALSPHAKRFWDANPKLIQRGIGSVGRFERNFAVFRNRVLPLAHGRKAVEELFVANDVQSREAYYQKSWNNWRWRSMCKVFFSRFLLGHLGRDRAFFKKVKGSVSQRMLSRAKHAVTELDPADNPYLQWILTGQHGSALPHALREENFDSIRNNVDRFEYHQSSVQDFLKGHPELAVDRFNLSDIFEFASDEDFESSMRLVASHTRPGGRLAYWNMLVSRERPESLADVLVPQRELAERLHKEDKAFFYSRFVVEERTHAE